MCARRGTARTYDRDAYGNLTSRVVDEDGLLTLTETYSGITNDTTSWLLGLWDTHAVQSCPDGQACVTRTYSATYDQTTGMQLTRTREPGAAEEQTTSWGYDLYGNVDVVSISAGGQSRTTTFTYDDEHVHREKITDPLGYISYEVYDPGSGVLYAAVDPAGLTTYMEVDGFYRQVHSELRSSPLGPHDGNPVDVSYSDGPPGPKAMQVVTEEETGQAVSEDLDPAGRVTRRTWYGMSSDTNYAPGEIPEGELVHQDYYYDARGRLEGTSLPYWDTAPMPAGSSLVQYDPLGRVLSTTEPNGFTYTYEYFSGASAADFEPGTKITRTEVTSGVESVEYRDSLGRTVKTEEPFPGGATCWTYGAFSQPASMLRNCAIGAVGPQPSTVYTYDGAGRLQNIVDPEMGPRTITYTGFDEPDVLTNAANEAIDYDYDGLGRVVATTTAQGTTTLNYDKARIGTLSWSSSVDGITRSYGYDGFGRTTSTTTRGTVKGALHAPRFSYSYGPGGRLDEITYPTANGLSLEVAHEYDQAGYLRKVKDPTSGAAYWTLSAANAASQVELEEFGNTATTTRAHHPTTLRPEEIRTQLGAADLQYLDYEWNDNGDLQSRSDLRNPAITHSESFQYDDMRRLTQSRVEHDGATDTVNVTYDALGNITSKTGQGNYTYNAVGQLTQTGFVPVQHDAAGRVTQMLGKTLTWKPNGKVATVSTVGEAHLFRYAAEGDRVFRENTIDGTAVMTVGGDYELRLDDVGAVDEMINRIRGAGGQVVAEVKVDFHIDQPVPPPPTVATRFVHDDHLGSGTVVSTISGDPLDPEIERVAYGPWGSARDYDDWTASFSGSLDDQSVGFTGHKASLDADFIDMGGRMYSPVAARFLSPDPIVVDPLSLQSHNRYSYVRNRPLVWSDPTGLADNGGGGGHGSTTLDWGSDACDDDAQNVCREIVGSPDGAGALGDIGGGGPNPASTWESAPGGDHRPDRIGGERDLADPDYYIQMADGQPTGGAPASRPRTYHVNRDGRVEVDPGGDKKPFLNMGMTFNCPSGPAGKCVETADPGSPAFEKGLIDNRDHSIGVVAVGTAEIYAEAIVIELTLGGAILALRAGKVFGTAASSSSRFRPFARSLGAAGDDLLLVKAVNSNLQHAIAQGVSRGIFPNAEVAGAALRAVTDGIRASKTFPAGTLVDTARAGRFLVPVGDGGYAVYQLGKNGTARLKTTLIAR